MKISGIYCIRNTVSGRVYVGMSGDLSTRWSGHLYLLRRSRHHSKKMQLSWNKHGEAAFTFKILEIVRDPARLVAREQHWMDAMLTARDFNCCPAAGSPLGFKHSPETLAKRSAAFKGKKRPPFSPEWRARIGAARRGTKAPEETKVKMSAVRKGVPKKPFTAEHRANISAACKGRKSPWTAERNRGENQRAAVSRARSAMNRSAKNSPANEQEKYENKHV